ncbi:MAG: hypothetical protein IJ737_08000 [Ruminococcus sp.]|nr:hypothetical protein [Ruminococcus sp.]
MPQVSFLPPSKSRTGGRLGRQVRLRRQERLRRLGNAQAAGTSGRQERLNNAEAA